LAQVEPYGTGKCFDCNTGLAHGEPAPVSPRAASLSDASEEFTAAALSGPCDFRALCCIVNSLDPMPFLTDTLYRAHVNRAPVDPERRTWLESKKLLLVEARTPDRGEIARLAYSYWEARGRQHGSELEDWLRAERELRKGYKQ
jgi:hypothetical protein